MKKSSIAIGVLVLSVLAGVHDIAAQSQTVKVEPIKIEPVSLVQSPYENVVQVKGVAEMQVAPDQIYMALTLRDGDVRGQSLSQIEARFLREIGELGVDPEKDLRVTGMTNAPRRRNQVDNQRSYELKVGSASVAQAVFEILGEMGVTDARITRMDNSRIEEYRMRLRTEAVQNATDSARALTAATDVSIGHAVYIEDLSSGRTPFPVPVLRSVMAAGADAGEAAGPVLEMKDITLSHSVLVKFSLRERGLFDKKGK